LLEVEKYRTNVKLRTCELRAAIPYQAYGMMRCGCGLVPQRKTLVGLLSNSEICSTVQLTLNKKAVVVANWQGDAGCCNRPTGN